MSTAITVLAVVGWTLFIGSAIGAVFVVRAVVNPKRNRSK